MRRLLFLVVVLSLAAGAAWAQDPIRVDPKHYKVVFENDQVRVLRIHYGPHEKSMMHAHPNSVAIALADQRAKFTFPDGKSTEREMKAGDPLWIPAETHLPEALGDKPLDVVLVEMKGKAAAKPAATAKPAPKK